MTPLRNTRWDLAAELLATTGLLAAWVLVARAWPDLPAEIPTHFDYAGRPDAWGDGAWILVPPIVSLAFWFGLTLVQRIPHHYNFPWKIAPENAATQYRLMRSMVIWLKAQLTWTFAYLVWASIRTAHGEGTGLNAAFLPIFLVAITLTLGVFITRAARAR